MYHDEIGMLSKQGRAQIALKKVSVQATLAGLMAETQLEQHYKNETGASIEVAYTFPLPVDAVLLHFEVEIGGAKHIGQVIPRQDADEKYEKAIDEGDAAFRLQKIGDGLYSATLGNIKNRETVVVRLTWGEVLSWSGLKMRYRLPTTLAPRYGQPKNMQPWQRPVADVAVEYPLEISLRLCGYLAKAAFECPSHQVSVAVVEDGIEIKLNKSAVMDRDFIVDIRPDAVSSFGLIARHNDINLAILNLLPPVVVAKAGDPGKDSVIVIDCSGSMAGESIAHAKEGVRLGLKQLRSEDRFAIIAYGSTTIAFNPSLQPANRKNIELAYRFVDGLGDLGGTETELALKEAMAYSPDSPLDVLLLTDGEDWNVTSSIIDAKHVGHRIFCIGIGVAVAEDTVRYLSDITGGASELLTPNEDMAERIERHFNRMRQPRFKGIKFDWSEQINWQTYPCKTIFAGDSITIYTAINGAIPRTMEASLLYFDGDSQKVLIDFKEAPAISQTLVRLGAHAYLAKLPDKEKLDWAVRHQLISDSTDYLITVERAEGEKTEDFPELQVVPQMLAAGWGGMGQSLQKRSFVAIETPILHCCATGAHDAVALSSSCGAVDYSRLDMSAVVRRMGRKSQYLLGSPPPLNGVMEKLNKQAESIIRSSLPTNTNRLEQWGLPAHLVALIRDSISAEYTENIVVLAFLKALADHALGHMLSGNFRKKLGAAYANSAMPQELISRFSSALDQVDSVSPSADSWDIPTFLHKQED